MVKMLWSVSSFCLLICLFLTAKFLSECQMLTTNSLGISVQLFFNLINVIYAFIIHKFLSIQTHLSFPSWMF